MWTHASRTSLDTVLAEHAQRDRESARTGAHAHKHEAKDIEHQFHHHHAHAHTHEQGSTTTSARPANPGKQEEAADSKPTEELRKEPSLSAPPSAERDDTLLLDVISGTHAFPTDKSGVNDAGEGTMEDVGHFAYLESLEYLMYNTYVLARSRPACMISRRIMAYFRCLFLSPYPGFCTVMMFTSTPLSPSQCYGPNSS